jgi:hypothetical protein
MICILLTRPWLSGLRTSFYMYAVIKTEYSSIYVFILINARLFILINARLFKLRKVDVYKREASIIYKL